MRRATILTAFLVLSIFQRLAHAEVDSMEPTYSKFAIIKGDAPSLYSGDLNLNMGILTVPGRGGMDYQVNLTYSSSLKLTDDASWIGLGWNIGAGSIVRSVDREPDDTQDGWMRRPNCPTEYDKYCDYKHQDKYFLNLGGGFEKLMIANDKTAYMHSWKPYKIEYDTQGDTNPDHEIMWWRVTTDNGTVYEFNLPTDTETKVITLAQGNSRRDLYASWINVSVGICEHSGADCTSTNYCPSYQINEGDCLGNCSQQGTSCSNSGDCSYSYCIPSQNECNLSGDYCTNNLQCLNDCTDKRCSLTNKSCYFDSDCQYLANDTCNVTQQQQCIWVPADDQPIYDMDQKTQVYHNGWLLTAIKSPDYKDRTGDGPSIDDYGTYIRFDYTQVGWNVTYAYPADGSMIESSHTHNYKSEYILGDYPGWAEVTTDVTNSYRSETKLDLWYLSSISTPVSSAKFVTAYRRDLRDTSDNNQAKRLKLIELYTTPNLTGTVVKAIYFDNEHYELAKGAPGTYLNEGRLTLKGITEYGKYTGTFSTTNTHLNPTLFEYANGDSMGSGDNPVYTAWAEDAWGYYNGKTGNSGSIYDNLNATDKADAWLLTKITYPTGGTVSYEYEPKTYRYEQMTDLGSDLTGGGVRVKSMFVNDGIIGDVETKFRYTSNDDGSGNSSGVISARPKRTYSYTNLDGSNGYEVTRNAFINLGAHEETEIKYAKVSVITPGSSGEMGETVTEFVTAKDQNRNDESYNSYGRPYTYNDWKRGEIKRVAMYNGSGNVVKESTGSYTPCLDASLHYVEFGVPALINYPAVESPSYKIVSGWKRIDNQSETMDGVVKTTTYSNYNVTNGAAQTVEEESGGKTVKKTTWYCDLANNCSQDEGGKVGSVLEARHMISLPYDSYVYESGTLTGYSKNTYHVETDGGSDYSKMRLYLKEGISWLDSNRNKAIDSSPTDKYITSKNLSWDDYGNVLTKSNPLNIVTTTGYVSGTSMVQSIETEGHTTSVVYDTTFTSLPAKITKADGTYVTYTYDNLGRLHTSTPSGGVTTTYNYYPVSGDISSTNLNYIETFYTVNTQQRKSASYFDGLGKGVVESKDSDLGTIVTTTVYDSFGRESKVSYPYVGSVEAGASGGEGYSYKSYYADPLSRVKEIYPNFLSKPLLKTTMTYGNDGNDTVKVTETDPKSIDTVSTEHVFKLSSKVLRDSKEVNTTRNPSTNLETLTDAEGKVTKFYHDNLGRKIASLRPDMIVFTAVSHPTLGSRTEEFEYDELGHLVLYRDGNLRGIKSHISYVYDSLGRMTSKSVGKDSDNSLVEGTQINIIYDDCAMGTGKVCSESNANQTTTYSYNTYGLLAEKHISITNDSGSPYVFYYTYNTAGELTKETIDPLNNISAEYEYNKLGQISNVYIKKGTEARVQVATLTYKADGRVEAITRNSNTNNLTTSYGYDELKRLNLIDNNLTTTQSSLGFDRYFKYDDLGRITKIIDDDYENNSKIMGDFSSADSYDAFGRLKKGTIKSFADIKINRAISYTYDNVGNRKTDVEIDKYFNPSKTVKDYTYNYTSGTNRLSSLANNLTSTNQSVSYDSNGNITGKYGYDHYGNMTKFNGVEVYFYDAGGKRVKAKNRIYIYKGNDVVFYRETFKHGDANGDGAIDISDALCIIERIFSGGSLSNPAELMDANNDGAIDISDAVFLISHIFSGGAAPTAFYRSTASLNLGSGKFLEIVNGDITNPTYYLTDQIGSASLAANSTGKEIGRQEYYPFGNSLTGNVPTRYKFTGKELDSDTGLYYYGARYYNPDLGRFMQRDTIDAGPNPYAYVSNNPLIATDPTGHAQLQPYSTNPKEVGWGGAFVNTFANIGVFANNLMNAPFDAANMGMEAAGLDENQRNMVWAFSSYVTMGTSGGARYALGRISSLFPKNMLVVTAPDAGWGYDAAQQVSGSVKQVKAWHPDTALKAVTQSRSPILIMDAHGYSNKMGVAKALFSENATATLGYGYKRGLDASQLAVAVAKNSHINRVCLANCYSSEIRAIMWRNPEIQSRIRLGNLAITSISEEGPMLSMYGVETTVSAINRLNSGNLLGMEMMALWGL